MEVEAAAAAPAVEVAPAKEVVPAEKVAAPAIATPDDLARGARLEAELVARTDGWGWDALDALMARLRGTLARTRGEEDRAKVFSLMEAAL